MESLQEMQDSDLFPVTASMVWGPASIPNQSSRLVPLSTQLGSAQIRQEAREFIEQNTSDPGPVKADGIVQEHTNAGTRLVPLKLKQMNTLGEKVLQESNTYLSRKLSVEMDCTQTSTKMWKRWIFLNTYSLVDIETSAIDEFDPMTKDVLAVNMLAVYTLSIGAYPLPGYYSVYKSMCTKLNKTREDLNHWWNAHAL